MNSQIDKVLVKLRKKTDYIASDLNAFVTDIGGWLQHGARQFSGAEQRALAQDLRIWSQQSLTDLELQAWIEELSDDGMEALTEQVAQFCFGFDIELKWLFAANINEYKSLRIAIERMITAYCNACKEGVEIQDDLQRFRRRYTWLSKQIKKPS